jgi:hypothetical protein
MLFWLFVSGCAAQCLRFSSRAQAAAAGCAAGRAAQFALK